MKNKSISLSPNTIQRAIFLIRGEKVLLDRDLASLYEVEVKALNQAVKRNLQRFPADFMFQLTWDEVAQLATQSEQQPDAIPTRSRSQSVTLKRGANPKYRPYAFTEQGVAMLSSVLKSERAIHVKIEIMRTFVMIRQSLSSHAELARKLAQIERKFDGQFKVVFDALHDLTAAEPAVKRRKIGFRNEDSK